MQQDQDSSLSFDITNISEVPRLERIDSADTIHFVKENTRVVKGLRKKIKNESILHYQSAKYFSKMHRVLHISHLLLNLVLSTLISSKLELDTTYMTWIMIVLQSTNTFTTQMEAFFGFHKRGGIHENVYKSYRSLLAKIDSFARNGIMNAEYETIINDYNEIEQLAPSYPSKIAKHLLTTIEDIDKDEDILNLQLENIHDQDDGGQDYIVQKSQSFHNYLLQCAYEYFGLNKHISM